MELDMSLSDDLVCNSIYEEVLQELDLLMTTTKTQLIGEPHFGLDMEAFLWDLQPSEEEIKNHIIDAINTYTTYLKTLTYDIDIQPATGTERTIYTVKMTIYKADESSVLKEKTYVYN